MKLLAWSMMCIASLFLVAFRDKPELRQHAINKQLYEDIRLAMLKEGVYARTIVGPTDGICINSVRIESEALDRSFYTYEEAEAFFCRVRQQVSDAINNNRLCRPYLCDFTFKWTISLSIWFLDPQTLKKVGYPKVGHVRSHEFTCRAFICRGEQVLYLDKAGSK